MKKCARVGLGASFLLAVQLGCSGEPTPVGSLGEGAEPHQLQLGSARGEQGHCSLPSDGAPKVSDLECEARRLPGTGHEYCVKAHPDCLNEGEGCFVVMTFNMGQPYGLSHTYQSRVDKPGEYGKFIVVGGGVEVDNDVMAELPRRIVADFPGADPNRIYALGNSRGAGSISAIAQANDSEFGTTYDVYAAVATFGGRFKHTDVFEPEGRFGLMIVNGQDDVAEPDGVRELAAINRCENSDVEWANVEAEDAYVPGDGTDIAQKLSFGECPGGDVLAYRFRDEGHVVDFDKNFDPKVRALNMAWDFFTGRTRDEQGVAGEGSACTQ